MESSSATEPRGSRRAATDERVRARGAHTLSSFPRQAHSESEEPEVPCLVGLAHARDRRLDTAEQLGRRV